MCQTSAVDSQVMVMIQLSKSPGPSHVATRMHQRWGEGRRTRLSDCRPLGQVVRVTLAPASAEWVVLDRLPFELSDRVGLASLVGYSPRCPVGTGQRKETSVTCQTRKQ